VAAARIRWRESGAADGRRRDRGRPGLAVFIFTNQLV
jgi:hypothetical protein